MASRTYDIVLLGAYGYTGLQAAEKIATQLPSNLKWAVAGRSATKLESLRRELEQKHPRGAKPQVEVVLLERDELHKLARQTKVVVNCIGPYCLYGTQVVDACAHNGTHYLDVTGESPWVKLIIERYHDIAQKTGAIIIPEIGIESAPSDLSTFLLASYFKEHESDSIAEVVNSVYSLKSTLSGGSLRTVFTLLDSFGPQQMLDAMRFDSMSLKPAPPRTDTFLRKLVGTHAVSGLGQLTTFSFGQNDVPIVYRSWSLLDYGPRFQFSFYMNVRNALIGFLIHVASMALSLFLVFAPTRWMMSKFAPYQPGEGPTEQEGARQHGEWRAIAHAGSTPGKKAFCRFRWDGALYGLTGAFLAHGAATLIYDDNIPAKRLGAGCLTPATLGNPFIQRLEKAGLKTEVRLVDTP